MGPGGGDARVSRVEEEETACGTRIFIPPTRAIHATCYFTLFIHFSLIILFQSRYAQIHSNKRA